MQAHMLACVFAYAYIYARLFIPSFPAAIFTAVQQFNSIICYKTLSCAKVHTYTNTFIYVCIGACAVNACRVTCEARVCAHGQA